MKLNHLLSSNWQYNLKKLAKIMKISVLLSVIMTFSSFAHNNIYSQDKISVNVENTEIRNILDNIESSTELRFFYDNDIYDFKKKISLSLKEVTISKAISLIFENKIEFRLKENVVILEKSQLIEKDNVVDIKQEDIEQRIITGIITDDNENPLPGATIIEVGTSNGTTSDFDGNFSISLENEDASLQISFIGFETQTIAVGNSNNISVQLTIDGSSLDEIVVIGYGSQKKSDLTGAVGSIKESQIIERPVATINQALAGKIAGVQVNAANGRPGGKSKVRIRGISSINSGNDPLYVVDGVQLPQGPLTFGLSNTAIDYINPSDIVSIEVLKDASSTAIYGARGANGVILVTTKKGKSGESRVTYNSEFFVSEYGPNATPKRLNSEQFQMIEQLAYDNIAKFDPTGWASGNYANQEPSKKRAGAFLGDLVNELFDSSGKAKYDTDWYNEIRQRRMSQNHQIGFSGGDDKRTFNASIGLRDERGLLINSYMKRYSTRVNFENQVNSWLKVGGTVDFSVRQENNQDTGPWVFESATHAFPFLPVQYATGNSPFFPPWFLNYASNLEYGFGTGAGGNFMYNPVMDLNNRKFMTDSHNFTGSFFTNINISKDLELRTSVSSNILNQGRKIFYPQFMNGGNNGAIQSNARNVFYSIENYLTYSKEIDDNNSITALLGASWQQTDLTWFQGDGYGTPSDGYGPNNLGAASFKNSSSSMSREALNSFFTRINYNLKDKYFFTFTARADGSSKFGKANKWAFFPSAAAAWRLSKEDFLSNSDVISNLKLRASYGQTGNSSIPAYSSEAQLGPGSLLGGSNIPGYTAGFGSASAGGTGLLTLENTGLRWEIMTQFDIGLELGLLNDRLNIEMDYYNRETTDMLLNAPVPESTGFSVIRQNIGSMVNKGFELSLNSINIDRPDFTWNSTFNISMNTNEVLSLASPSDIFDVASPQFLGGGSIIRIGEAIGSMYGFTRLGVWGTNEAEEAAKYNYRGGKTVLPGDIKYKDLNGDYVIDNSDRSIIGNGYADAYGTFTNYFKYKSFDLTLDVQYSIGNDLADLGLHWGENSIGGTNLYTTVLNAWTPDNQNTMIPQVRNASAGSVSLFDSHMVKDASFLRGNNLMLGYTFKSESIQRLNLNKLRLYVSAQNFFLLMDKDIMSDPQVDVANWNVAGGNVASQGFKWHEYPKSSTFVIGLQVGI
ncbi:TonB-dependent receptor [Flavobacteriaceae bacterium]|nr:TonB-dependent receptor [Flavobacteriaceae bacterium]